MGIASLFVPQYLIWKLIFLNNFFCTGLLKVSLFCTITLFCLKNVIFKKYLYQESRKRTNFEVKKFFWARWSYCSKKWIRLKIKHRKNYFSNSNKKFVESNNFLSEIGPTNKFAYSNNLFAFCSLKKNADFFKQIILQNQTKSLLKFI